MKFQAVVDAVRSLPAQDRARLVHLIQRELQSEEAEPELTPAAMREVKRRLAAYKGDPSIGVPWEEVEARIQKQLKELEVSRLRGA